MSLLRDPAATESQRRPLRYLGRVNLNGSSSSRARELVWFRPRLDGDALVAVIEAIVAEHLISLAGEVRKAA